jgi:hypothetical protein
MPIMLRYLILSQHLHRMLPYYWTWRCVVWYIRTKVSEGTCFRQPCRRKQQDSLKLCQICTWSHGFTTQNPWLFTSIFLLLQLFYSLMFGKSFGFRLRSAERGKIYKMDVANTAGSSVENRPLDTASLLPYIRKYKIHKYIIYNTTYRMLQLMLAMTFFSSEMCLISKEVKHWKIVLRISYEKFHKISSF